MRQDNMRQDNMRESYIEMRVSAAARAVEYYNRDDDDREQTVRDLLTDLRHYCDCYGINFADEDKSAYTNYSMERFDARRGVI